MRQIRTIHLHNARNAEHQLFHEMVLNALTPQVAEELGIGPQRAAYAALFGRERRDIVRTPAYKQTPEIVALKRKRQELYLYVKQMAEVFLRHPDAACRKAAEHLTFVLDPFRRMMQTPQNEASAELGKLVRVLREEGNAPAVAALGLTEAVTLLGEANEAFIAVNSERADERWRRETGINMERIRPQVDKAYRRVATVVNALAVVSAEVTHDTAGAETLDSLIDGINAIVMDLRDAMHRRQARDSNEGAEEEADEPAADATPSGTKDTDS